MSSIKNVKLPNNSEVYDIDATTVNGHDVDMDVPQILKDLPTGSISTVTDAAPLPLNALKVSVEAWQEGSGDPSPSNVRPIHGWSSGEIGVVGKNLFNASLMTSPTDTAKWLQIQLKANVTYTVSSSIPYSSSSAYLFAVQGTDTSGTTSAKNGVGSGHNQTITTGNDGIISIAYRCNGASGFLNLDDYTYQIEVGTSPTDYEPFVGNTTYTQQFPQTIYGAEWDVVDGELKQTDGYIASYNGETLPSTWISDRDVYASGTTPTTGAEVVYKLATPTTIPQQPEVIRMLEGVNNLYADCGKVIEGEYFVDSDLTDGIVSVAEKINTDTNDKVTQTEVPTATSGTDYYSLTFAKDHNTNTNTDGLYKTGSVVICKNAFNNIPELVVNDTNNPNSLTKSSDIAPGQITIAKVVNNTPKIITVSPDDITLTNNTWDGTRTSLKTTLANIDAKNVTMTARLTDERMHVLVNANNHTSGEAGAVKYGSFFYNPSRNAICNIQNLDDPDGNGSFAWGDASVATGECAQAMGFNCRATNKCQHVFGDSNVLDPRGALSDDYGEYVEIVGNGHKSVAGSSNARTLDWSGNEWIAGTLTQGSSEKIKKNISPITDDEISKVLELNGVKFDYIKTGTNNQAERGFIAEEVAEVLPNLVTEEWTDDNGNLLKPASLNYLAIIPYLVEICKKQQEEIDELKQKIKE